MRPGDVAAGALLVNAIPHAIVGLAGKRCMTPLGGVNSSPAVNLAWAGLNMLAGTALLAPGSWRRIDQHEADQRLRAVTSGIIGMAGCAAAYELVSAPGPGSSRSREGGPRATPAGP